MTRVLAAAAALTLVACAQQVPPPEVGAPSAHPMRDYDLGTTTSTARPSTTAPRRVSRNLAGGRRGTGTVPATSPASDRWARLRQCESGGNYANKSNPKYRGAYQAAWTTWSDYWRRHGRPDLVGIDPADASVADQDSFAHGLYAESGARPWPQCGRYVK